MPAAFIWLIKGPSAAGRQRAIVFQPGPVGETQVSAGLLLQPSNLIVETITASQDPISGDGATQVRTTEGLTARGHSSLQLRSPSAAPALQPPLTWK